MSARILTQPAAEPITLDQARKHCRVNPDDTSDDWFFTTIAIPAARERCEVKVNRPFMRRIAQEVYDSFKNHALELTLLPVLAVEKVEYIDAASSTLVTLPADQWACDDQGDLERAAFFVFPVYGIVWPCPLWTPNAVRVTYRCGFSDEDPVVNQQDAVPPGCKAAMLLTIGALFEHREEIMAGASPASIPTPFIDSLLGPQKIYRL